jgi:hypothetical protein
VDSAIESGEAAANLPELSMYTSARTSTSSCRGWIRARGRAQVPRGRRRTPQRARGLFRRGRLPAVQRADGERRVLVVHADRAPAALRHTTSRSSSTPCGGRAKP